MSIIGDKPSNKSWENGDETLHRRCKRFPENRTRPWDPVKCRRAGYVPVGQTTAGLACSAAAFPALSSPPEAGEDFCSPLHAFRHFPRFSAANAAVPQGQQQSGRFSNAGPWWKAPACPDSVTLPGASKTRCCPGLCPRPPQGTKDAARSSVRERPGGQALFWDQPWGEKVPAESLPSPSSLPLSDAACHLLSFPPGTQKNPHDCTEAAKRETN